MGRNLHYGLFGKGNETLEQATNGLVDHMASLSPFDSNSQLLDVGCGIGTPAFRLAEQTGCSISAISISARGITVAEQMCDRKGLSERVEFYQRDALDNKFPDASFDVAWVMESSHLMHDKHLLCTENYRVLRNNGVMLLCDLILKRELTVLDIYNLREDISALNRSFGKAKMETLNFYQKTMQAVGFTKIGSHDISDMVFPTLDKWLENLESNQISISAHLPMNEIDNFARSCEILKKLFTQEVLGYGIVTGIKSIQGNSK